MSYSYTLNGLWVNPRGDWEVNYERNVGQIFFRRIFTGELTFIGDDYQTLMSQSDCDVLEFIIYCGTEEWWEGQFKFPYDFDINEDSCVAVGEPEVVDEYSCIMDLYEVEYEDNMAAGGIQPIINDCVGGPIYTFAFFAFRLFGSTASGFTSHIKTLLGAGNINCGLTLSSSFFSLSNFPNGDNYAASYGTNNYITGATNRLRDIFLMKNSSVRQEMGGTGCEPTLPSRSFKFLEEILRIAFNAYWYIDQNGHFRIEHRYFFDDDFPESDFEPGINLNTLVSSNGKVFAHRRNKYTYETGELYDQERWTWQHYEGTEGTVAHGADFEGVPIFYGAAEDQKSDCVPGEFKEKEFPLPKVWTDIDWAWALRANPPAAGGVALPDTINCNNGYCMLDIITATGHINCEASILAAGNIMNMHLSTAGLQEHYHTYDRIFLDGDMNSGSVVLFDTAIPVKLQEEIEFTWCCDTDFDPLQFIRTGLGDGRVKAATHKKRSITVELLY